MFPRVDLHYLIIFAHTPSPKAGVSLTWWPQNAVVTDVDGAADFRIWVPVCQLLCMCMYIVFGIYATQMRYSLCAYNIRLSWV